jgi:hypothetical protein
MNPHHVHTNRDRCQASLTVFLRRSCHDIAEARCLLPVFKAAGAGAKRGHRQVAQRGPGGAEERKRPETSNQPSIKVVQVIGDVQ